MREYVGYIQIDLSSSFKFSVPVALFIQIEMYLARKYVLSKG